MFGLRTQEILLILVVLLLLFGATKLPQLGKSFGQAIRNFKKGFSEDAPEGSDPESAKKSPDMLASSKKGAEADASDAQRVKHP